MALSLAIDLRHAYDPASDNSQALREQAEELGMTAEENVRRWFAHLAGEFSHRNVEESLATMVEDASVCHVPTGSGGTGKNVLRRYYRDEFIPSIPEDWTLTLRNRLATDHGIAEEAQLRFHHSKQREH
jgi:hypothetical protein